MSMFILASGTLAKQPEQKTSKNGKPYTMAQIKVPLAGEGNETLWVTIFAFNDEAQRALLASQEGDAISAQGKLTVGIYTNKEGTSRPSISVAADSILQNKATTRQRDQRGSRDRDDGYNEANVERFNRWK